MKSVPLSFSSAYLMRVYLEQAVRELRSGINVFKAVKYWDPARYQLDAGNDGLELCSAEVVLVSAQYYMRQFTSVRKFEKGSNAFFVKGNGMLKRLVRPLLYGFTRFDRKQWIQRLSFENDSGFPMSKQMCYYVAKTAKIELDRLHENVVHCSLYYPHILVSETLEVKFVGYSHWMSTDSRFFVFKARENFDVGSFFAAESVYEALEIDNYWLFCFLWGFFTGYQITVDSKLEDVLPGCCEVEWMVEVAKRNFLAFGRQ